MEDLEKSQLFFKSYVKILWLSVLLPAVIGTVAMLKWVTPDDYTLMGPNFAMALMSFLYAVVLHAAVILPYSVMLKRSIIALNSEL
jgi:flagellar motor component MotA